MCLCSQVLFPRRKKNTSHRRFAFAAAFEEFRRGPEGAGGFARQIPQYAAATAPIPLQGALVRRLPADVLPALAGEQGRFEDLDDGPPPARVDQRLRRRNDRLGTVACGDRRTDVPQGGDRLVFAVPPHGQSGDARMDEEAVAVPPQRLQRLRRVVHFAVGQLQIEQPPPGVIVGGVQLEGAAEGGAGADQIVVQPLRLAEVA